MADQGAPTSRDGRPAGEQRSRATSVGPRGQKPDRAKANDYVAGICGRTQSRQRSRGRRDDVTRPRVTLKEVCAHTKDVAPVAHWEKEGS